MVRPGLGRRMVWADADLLQVKSRNVHRRYQWLNTRITPMSNLNFAYGRVVISPVSPHPAGTAIRPCDTSQSGLRVRMLATFNVLVRPSGLRCAGSSVATRLCAGADVQESRTVLRDASQRRPWPSGAFCCRVQAAAFPSKGDIGRCRMAQHKRRRAHALVCPRPASLRQIAADGLQGDAQMLARCSRLSLCHRGAEYQESLESVLSATSCQTHPFDRHRGCGIRPACWPYIVPVHLFDCQVDARGHHITAFCVFQRENQRKNTKNEHLRN